jgi:hypothetical protein
MSTRTGSASQSVTGAFEALEVHLARQDADRAQPPLR